MKELTAVLKAREFLRDAKVTSVPVDIESLARLAGAKIERKDDMALDESGKTFPYKGKHYIWINDVHSYERQRFTVLHEIGHIMLGLPSLHAGAAGSGLFHHGSRASEEVACDAFAAECLLPYTLISQDLKGKDVSLELAKSLASHYEASLSATMSRVAVNCEVPCAFVIIRDHEIHYVTSSKYLREMGGWINTGVPTPHGSVAEQIEHSNDVTERYDEVSTTVWFNNGVRGYELVAEETIHRPRFKECLSLIWVDEALKRHDAPAYHVEDESPLLKELDGQLPWPGRSRRR